MTIEAHSLPSNGNIGVLNCFAGFDFTKKTTIDVFTNTVMGKKENIWAAATASDNSILFFRFTWLFNNQLDTEILLKFLTNQCQLISIAGTPDNQSLVICRMDDTGSQGHGQYTAYHFFIHGLSPFLLFGLRCSVSIQKSARKLTMLPPLYPKVISHCSVGNS
ncbi:MAG: hypothetical protein P8X89_02365 [Reinekea sp.]